MPRKSISLDDKEIILARLEKKTIIDSVTGCKLWQGSNNGSGYGEIRIGNYKFYTHKISAYLFLGHNLFSDLQINHKITCPNRNCWNPEHLYEGNEYDNMMDAIKLGYNPGEYNKLKTQCKYGHEFTEENTYFYKNERQCKICRKETINRLRI